SVVHDLLRRREAVLNVHSMDVPNVITKPAVERISRRGNTFERYVEVVALPVHDGDVPTGCWLDEDRFSGDPKSLARSLVGVATIPAPTGDHGRPIDL